MFQGFQKSTENCRYLFPSLRYLTFIKTFFKSKFQKMTKTVNLNVRVQIIFST